MHFLYIGQGDSILIKTPDNKLILVDSGPDNSVVSKLSEVIPYGIKSIDLYIISHFDEDHFGGSPELFDIYDIKNVLYAKTEKSNDSIQHFYNKTEFENSKHVDPFKNKNIKVGCCVYLKILWPLSPNQNLESNDMSVAFELVYKNFSGFFAGDLSTKYEDEILKTNWIDADLLKVSHHGSKTSTSKIFLEDLKPEIAVISVGKNNKFSHPNTEVLKVLEGFDLSVLRTDQLGSIHLIVDQNGKLETDL